MKLTEAQRELYDRNLRVDGFSGEDQAKLLASRVLVVGAGGLGSPVLIYLAAAGVGALRVVDDDVVTLSNLQRQVLYGHADVGRVKVDVAGERLKAVNPALDYEGHRVRFDEATGRALAEGCNVIVDCCDNYATRMAMDKVSAAERKPFVHGSVEGLSGQIAVFSGSRRYADLFPCEPKRKVPGVLSPMCGLVGSIEALECIKLITGFSPALENTLLIVGPGPVFRKIEF